MGELKEARPLKKAGIPDYIVGLVSYLLILLPAALALLYVRAFGVSVVVTDAWAMVPLFDKWSSGTLGASDLFRQHLEHRMFFPKGVELLLGVITRYDNVAEMYLIQICFLVTLVILLLAFRVSIEPRLFRTYSLLLFVPVSFLIFSLRQHENILWGYQISFAFTQMFGVLALFLLYVVGRKRFEKTAFVAALGSGTVAAFSVAQGLFVWPAGLLQLFISPIERSTKRVLISVWSLVGLGVWIAYFVDYTKPRNNPSMLYAFEHPVAGMRHFFDLLGSSLFWQQNSAFVGGLLVACLALASLLLIYRDRRLGEYSFWVSLLFYSLLILVAITLGRSGFGGEQALLSRYTSFSILVVVSVYVMLVKIAFERRSSITTILPIALSGFVLLSAAISYSEGIEMGRGQKIAREKAAFLLSTYESQPDEALTEVHRLSEVLTETLHPRAEVIRDRAPTLQGLGYNVFSEPQGPPPLSALSPVDSSPLYAMTITGPGISERSGSLVVPKEGPFIKVSGWAVDTDNKNAAGGVYIDIDGELFPAFYGMERRDVAGSLGVPSYRYSGFERAIPVSEIGAGAHELALVVLTTHGNEYYRPDQKIALEIE